MPREPRHNWGAVCPQHTPRPRPELQQLPPALYVGWYVKIGFPIPDSTQKEHMWVRVKGVNPDGTLWGILNNDPVAAKGIKDGDRIDTIAIAEIEEILP